MDNLENIHRDNNMSNMFINKLSDSKIRYKLAQEMPFLTCPDYEMLRECSTQISDIFKLFNNNNFARQIKSIVNNFTNENYNCKYYIVERGKKNTFPSTSLGVFCNYLIKRTNIPGDV